MRKDNELQVARFMEAGLQTFLVPCNLHPVTVLVPCTLYPAPCNLYPCNLYPATCNLHPVTCNLHTCNLQPAPCNLFQLSGFNIFNSGFRMYICRQINYFNLKKSGMAEKIKVANPVVELDGDEMTGSYGNSLKTS